MRPLRILSSRSRTPIALAIVTAASLLVAALAVFAKGYPTTHVSLNDGGIWVTRSSDLLVGHLNYASQVLDSGLHTKSAQYDVLQQGNTVLVHDEASNTLTAIDTAHVALQSDGTLPAAAQVSFGGQTVAIVASGKLFVVPASSVGGLSLSGATPAANLGAGGVATVDSSGTVHAASDVHGTVMTISPKASGGFSPPRTQSISGVRATARLQITSVGSQTVVLDSKTGTLYQPGRSAIRLQGGIGAVLQQAGPSSNVVLVETSSSLIEQPLTGGKPLTRSVTRGIPAAPVSLDGCSYGVWSGSAAYVRECAGTRDDVSSTIPGATPSSSLLFRVNRDAIVVNDIQGGSVWLPTSSLKRVNNWQDVVPPTSQRIQKQTSQPQQNPLTLPKRDPTKVKPIAVDDHFGVRSGRATLLPVLLNDSDPAGNLLTVSLVGPAPAGLVIRPVLNGSEFQVQVPASGRSSYSFRYQDSDGQGNTAQATVTLTVHGPGVNAPPVENKIATIQVEAGASVSYDALQNWQDPDGDPIYLVSAATGAGGTVKFRGNGVVTYSAVAGSTGVRSISLRVSDGRSTPTSGTLHVDVQPVGSLSPIANADRASAVTGVPTTMSPLINDVAPSGQPLRLVRVQADAGATVTDDVTKGTVTFAAARAGTYYVQYLVSDGPGSAVGLIRVDVVAAQGSTLPPVAVSDLALLPSGGNTVLDVLANDDDPAGGILVVQSVEVQPGSGIGVQLLEHQLVRITDVSGISSPVTFQYTVTDGLKSAIGQVTVQPVAAPAKLHAPVTVDDTATVRAGDVVTIDVLANDYQPDGAILTLDSKLGAPLPTAAQGAAFVSEGKLRFHASSTPGTVHVTYTVSDPQGDVKAGYVTITVTPLTGVNSPPVPLPVTGRVLAGGTVRIPIPLDGIDPDGDSVQLVGAGSAPKKGLVTTGDTWLNYQAFSSASGTDTFTYVVRDRLGAEATGTVSVGIGADSSQNQNPNAVKDAIDIRPGRVVSVAVLANDSDPDGDVVHLVAGGLSVPKGIAAVVSGDRVQVTAPKTSGTFSISYTISDPFGAEDVGILSVKVDPRAPLVAPIARDDRISALSLAGAKTVSVNVLTNDEDPDGTATDLTVSVSDPAATVKAGTVTLPVTSAEQVVTYTDTDPDGLTDSAFITVPGTSGLLPTLSSTVPIRIISGKTVTISLSDHIHVRPGRAVRIATAASVSSSHNSGSSLIKDPTHLVYTPATGYYGADAIGLLVTDGTGPSDPAGREAYLSIPIQVVPSTDVSPTLANSSVTVSTDGGDGRLALDKLTTDPNGLAVSRLKYTVVGQLSKVTASISGQTLDVKAAQDATPGPIGHLTIQVTDGKSAPTTGTVDVNVIATSKPLAVANADVVNDAKQGVPVRVAVLANDYDPYPGTPLSLLSATLQSGTGSVLVRGSDVEVTPGAKFVGTMTMAYVIGDASKLTSRQVQGQITVTVKGAPDAPTNLQVTSIQDRTVVLSWDPPSSNGSPITGYTVTGAGYSKACDTTTCTLDGLTNNVTYRFTVVAKNAVGASPASAPSGPARPDARPDAPAAPTVVSADTSLKISWAAPHDTGSPVTSYTLDISGPTSDGVTEKTGIRGTAYVWSGLTNGSSYQVKVRAYNQAPTPSDFSPYSASAIPVGRPFAPTGVAVTPVHAVGSQAQVQVTWTAGNENGQAIDTSTVTASQSGRVVQPPTTVSGTATTATLSIPTSSTPYSYTVVEHTPKGGTSPASAAFVAQAANAPDKPASVAATDDDQSSVLTVQPPSSFNGNSPAQVTYVWSAPGTPGGSVQASLSAVKIHVSGLVNGQSYQFSVVAQSGVAGAGTSAATASPTVVPYGQASIDSLTAHPGDGSVNFTWSNNGNGRSINGVTVYVNGGLVNAGSNPTSYTVSGLGSATSVNITVDIATSGNDSARAHGSASGSGTSNTQQGTYWVTQSGTSLVFHWSNVAAGRWPTVTKFRCWSTPPQTQTGSIDHVGADTAGGITAGSGSATIACNSGTNGNYSIEPWTNGPWLQNGHSLTEP